MDKPIRADVRFILPATREFMRTCQRCRLPILVANLKRRVRKGKFCGILMKVNSLLIAVALLISLIAMIAHPIQMARKLPDSMTFQEIAEELKPLGVNISQATPDEIVQYGDFEEKALNLVCMEGMGTYDFETWEWIPSTSGVYWFDLEVINVDSMYSNFLRGVAAMDPELEFTDIYETYDPSDLEKGIGPVQFGYTYCGVEYTCQVTMRYDWFDLDALAQVADTLSRDKSKKDLWYAEDGSQGILLYYGSRHMPLAP